LLIRLPKLIPEFPLLDVGKVKFPVLFRLVDTLKEALSLLLLRKVEVDLDDTGAIEVNVFLQVYDRAKPVVPNRLLTVR